MMARRSWSQSRFGCLKEDVIIVVQRLEIDGRPPTAPDIRSSPVGCCTIRQNAKAGTRADISGKPYP
jgi:hypothetical protein